MSKNSHRSVPRKILIIETKDRHFTPAEKIPEEFLHLLLPFAGAYLERDADCDILNQAIWLDGFSIWGHHVFVYKDILLAPFTPHHILALHFMLLANIEADIDGKRRFSLQQRQANLFSLHSRFHTAPLEAGQDIFSFHINITQEALHSLALRYPELEHLAKKPISLNSGPLNRLPYDINPLSFDIIKAMYSCRLIEDQAKHFLQRCCLDLFTIFSIQDEYLENVSSAVPVTEKECEALDQALEYLSIHLPPPSRKKYLAEKWGFDENDFDIKFRQHFHLTFEKFLVLKKMMGAYELIVSTSHSLSYVAWKTGFRNRQELISRFESYYGCDIIAIRNAQ